MFFSSLILRIAVAVALTFSLSRTGRAQVSSSNPPATREQVPTAVPSPPSLKGEVPRGSKSNSLLIRPEFLPGNTYRFVTRTELKSPAGDAVIEQQARFDAKVRVDGKRGIVVKARTERLDVQLQAGGRTAIYRSLEPADQETLIGKHFQSALYRSVDFTLNQDLRIDSSEEGGRAIPESPLPGMPRFGPEELKQLIGMIPQGFSVEPVRFGESWVLQGSRSVSEIGILNFEVTYRLAGPINFEDNQCLSIEFSGQLNGEVPLSRSDGVPAGESLAGLQGNGMRGRILFDPLDKMVRYIEQSLDLNLVMPGIGSAAPQQVPVQQTTAIRLLHVIATP
ncbi:MAG TPA: hypothetical protein PK529_03115 [Verrucomicrobiales bacterium]|nr:hypothetical protein [Verrucomicrobiales bacterium]